MGVGGRLSEASSSDLARKISELTTSGGFVYDVGGSDR